MGRINARAPPSDPARLTTWTLKVCQQSDYEAVKDITLSRNRQRDIKLAPGIVYQLSEPSKKMAATAQMFGQIALESCHNCLAGKAPFSECVILEGQMVGKCAGCYYLQCNCNLAEGKVSWLTGSGMVRLPSFIGRTPPLKKRNERAPTKRKLSIESSQALPSFSGMTEIDAKRARLGAMPIMPAAVPGSNTDVLVCGSLYLPNPKYCSLPQFWIELISSLEPAFRHRNTRDTSSLQIRRPIQNLQQAFEAFKSREQHCRKKQGHQHIPRPDELFVRPSGKLTSPLAHLLHQPSTTTLNMEPDAEVTDYSNGCLRQIMGNAYTEDTFVFDWLHRRHRKSRGFEEYSAATLKIHEQFTMDILESLDSKVILIYGKVIQERILTHPQLRTICFPCWGPLEGVTIQIFLEEGFRNAEPEYRIRFYGLFLTHPQRQFYEPEDSPTAQLQDTITKLAVQMTSYATPCHEGYYAKRKWMKSNIRGQELYILNQRKKRTAEEVEQWSSLQEKHESAGRALDDSASGDKDPRFFCKKPHDIETLQKILPQAISAAQHTGKAWHRFIDLPEAVCSWLKGIKQSVFPDIEIQDLQNIKDEYNERYQAYLASVYAIPPPLFGDDEIRQALLHMMYAQQDQVSKLKGPLIHLYYTRLDDYAVRLQCTSCKQMLDDDHNARWAINRPDHYWSRRPHCHSQSCKGKRRTAAPVDNELRRRSFLANKTAHHHLLYTQSNATALYLHRDQLIRRSKEDDVLTIESVCIRCGENTEVKSGSSVYVDEAPRWTIGAKPKYVERRPICMRCVNLGRASGRFVPKDPTIMSVDTDWLNAAAKICQSYRSELRELLVSCFPPCRRAYRYGQSKSEAT